MQITSVGFFYKNKKKLKRWTRSDGAGVVEIHPETELNTIWKSSPEEEKKKQEWQRIPVRYSPLRCPLSLLITTKLPLRVLPPILGEWQLQTVKGISSRDVLSLSTSNFLGAHQVALIDFLFNLILSWLDSPPTLDVRNMGRLRWTLPLDWNITRVLHLTRKRPLNLWTIRYRHSPETSLKPNLRAHTQKEITNVIHLADWWNTGNKRYALILFLFS